MDDFLRNKSIEIIIGGQHPSGAFAACPNFSNYKYCWLRDGSFVAHAMDICGLHEPASRFFGWVDRVIAGQDEKVKRAIHMARSGKTLLNCDFLPARYELDGRETDDNWPNFQLDGYGAWLWALSEHMRFTGRTGLAKTYRKSINATINYLSEFYRIPNYDCWEENGDKVHTSTLICIYGGLKSIAHYTGGNALRKTIDEIREFILNNCIVNGRLCKYIGTAEVDASLLWASVPFKLLDVENKTMVNTVEEIENKLLHHGGVHRYAGDTYYGGGEWILLSCWLGWYYAERGEKDKALIILDWVKKHANVNGELPEQILEHVNNRHYIDEWKGLWGDVASPLLWSHAMYLILDRFLSGYPLEARK